jgi:hypothetical protein
MATPQPLPVTLSPETDITPTPKPENASKTSDSSASSNEAIPKDLIFMTMVFFATVPPKETEVEAVEEVFRKVHAEFKEYERKEDYVKWRLSKSVKPQLAELTAHPESDVDGWRCFPLPVHEKLEFLTSIVFPEAVQDDWIKQCEDRFSENGIKFRQIKRDEREVIWRTNDDDMDVFKSMLEDNLIERYKCWQ